MERWAGKVAVITGASSGIGLVTAQAFVRKGLIVVGLARRKTAMENGMKGIQGPGKFHAKECDLSSEENIDSVFEWIKKNLGTAHILINNAGVMKESSIADASTKEMQFIINVNVVGALICAKRAMQLMKENGAEGHIVNINSVVGLNTTTVPGRHFNVYSPTKYALRSLSETLAHELNNTKIRVSNISPGVVKTELLEMANMDTAFLDVVPVLKPEDIADAVMYAVGAPHHVRICEVTIKPTNDAFS
ncbi:farnesol dehydrogenase-like [Nasonia vitripennis]|uniref:Farnesol dehydrogenase-like n=1 Tax=Nasonia vitripennis TaxID=7425 RepID=A0A7M7G275_NASVI|nr:farnesol dehydrogenase-like [Nasonia vitripennis]